MAAKEVTLKRTFLSILVILLLISGIFLINGYMEGHFRSVETLRAYVSGYGIFAPLVLTVIQALQVVIPVVPGFFGNAVGTGLFGGWTSFWCNYIGISAGSIIAFFLAKWLGENIVRLFFPPGKYDSYVEWISRKKSYTILFFWSILLPLAPDDFLCYFSGLIGMDTKKFIWIIILAKPWCILFYSLLFEYII